MTSMGLEKIEYKLCIKMAVQEGEGRQVRLNALIFLMIEPRTMEVKRLTGMIAI